MMTYQVLHVERLCGDEGESFDHADVSTCKRTHLVRSHHLQNTQLYENQNNLVLLEPYLHNYREILWKSAPSPLSPPGTPHMNTDIRTICY